MKSVNYLLCLAVCLIASCCFVDTQSELYECYMRGDPQVITWKPINELNNPIQNQDCYSSGSFVLVKNEFVHYRVFVTNGWIVAVELFFYNGTSKNLICLVYSEGNEMDPHDENRCRKEGVTWSKTISNSEILMTFAYSKANFVTTIRAMITPCDNGAYFNIYVWQPKTLADRSTGICTKNDPSCMMIPHRTDSDSEHVRIRSRSQTITDQEAGAICKTYVDTYLNKIHQSLLQPDANMNTTIDYVTNTCLENLVSTGELEVARSALDVLMMKELTRDVTSVDAIQTIMRAGAQEALRDLHAAIEEADTKVRHLFNQKDTRVPCNPLNPPGMTRITTTTTITTPKPTSIKTTTPKPTFITTTTPAQANDLYECYAYGDPHVVTWHPKTGTYQHYHKCYENGFFELVRNEFVFYKVQVSRLFSIDIEMFFYNGVNRIPICLLIGYNFVFEMDDEAKCKKNGITWSLVQSASENLLTVSYTKANFSTNARQVLKSFYNTRHYNLHVWQTKALSDRSTGICRRDDTACLRKPSKTDSELNPEEIWPQRRSITENQARLICKTHIDAFLSRSRKAPYQRSINTNDTISIVMEACMQDVTLTGIPEMARSSLDVLMIEELTADVTSPNSIKQVIDSGVQEALVTFNEASEEAEAETPQILGIETSTTTAPTTITTTTRSIPVTTATPSGTTTTAVPLASYKCAIYQDMYVQTWHTTNQASPPTRSCLGTSGNFELVRNKYVRFTLRTTGSVIDELTVILFDGISTNAICTISVVGQDAGWMDCEQNGITPSLIQTGTHETLTVYYAKANFTTIITRDIGINVGRFNINVYLNPELAIQSTGICHLASSCTGTRNVQSKNRFRREIN